MKTVAVLLADGFEEIEAVVPSDILKRLGYEVITAGIKPGTVTGAHGIRATPQCGIADLDADSLDAVFLPGGMPGSTNLRDCPAVIALLRKLYESGKTVSAICAAPIVLHKAGITGERRVTGYPGSEQMAPGPRPATCWRWWTWATTASPPARGRARRSTSPTLSPRRSAQPKNSSKLLNLK